jgi:hypothetical protein
MSVKLELYQAIKAKLQAIPEVRNVLHYNGQDLTNYEQDNAKRFPQVWIQLGTIEWQPSELQAHQSNRTQQQKSGTVAITIYYASFSLNEDDETFETDLTAIDKIYRALTMLDSDNFAPLQRVSESDLSTNNNVRIWPQIYSTMLTECAVTGNDTDAAPVTIQINKTIV